MQCLTTASALLAIKVEIYQLKNVGKGLEKYIFLIVS